MSLSHIVSTLWFTLRIVGYTRFSRHEFQTQSRQNFYC